MAQPLRHPLTQAQKKKIVFLLPMLCAGGAERVQIVLANNLDCQKYDTEFVTLTDGPIRNWIAKSVTVHDLKERRIRGAVMKLYKKLKILQPDIVVSSLVHMNMLALLLKPFFPQTKFIVRESSLPSVLMKEYGMKGYFCRYVYKYLYPHADLVISPTSVIVDEFRETLKLRMNNHKTLYNPVDSDHILAHIPEQFSIPENRKRTVHFICAGRLSYEKGFGRLIEALPHLSLPYDWRLDIYGEGKDRPRLEALISAHGLEEHVFLQGYHKNPWGLIAQADCLLVPSLWEGMPNVVLEALVCGTKVIGIKDAGGIIEIRELTEKGAVHVAKAMEDFIYMMNAVEPQVKTERNPSLLPKSFQLSEVMARFEDLL